MYKLVADTITFNVTCPDVKVLVHRHISIPVIQIPTLEMVRLFFGAGSGGVPF